MNPTRSSVYFGYTELRKKKEADSQRFLYKQRTSVFKSTTYENMNIYLHYCGYMYDHLPCQCFLTPLERKQHSIDKIDLPSSEGPTDHEVKHERTRLCTRRLNVIEIVAQFQQEESIMRSKSSRLSRMTKPN